MATRDDLAEAFEAWVLDPARGDTVEVPTQLPAGRVVTDQWAAAAVAYELADDQRQLPDRVGRVLRVPETATWAHAARLVWSLRHDPQQPTVDHADAVCALQALDAVAFQRLWRAVDAAVARLGVGEAGGGSSAA